MTNEFMIYCLLVTSPSFFHFRYLFRSLIFFTSFEKKIQKVKKMHFLKIFNVEKTNPNLCQVFTEITLCQFWRELQTEQLVTFNIVMIYLIHDLSYGVSHFLNIFPSWFSVFMLNVPRRISSWCTVWWWRRLGTTQTVPSPTSTSWRIRFTNWFGRIHINYFNV